MRWSRANLEEKQELRAATSASAKRHAEGMWHDVTRKGLDRGRDREADIRWPMSVIVLISSAYRVAGGSRPPPAPTERSVRISRTTLFGEGFTAQRMPGTAGMAEPSVVAVAHYELSLLFVRILLS